MKKKSSLAIILSMVVIGILAFGGTLAWFNSQAFVQNSDTPIEGSVTDKYYDRGTGTENDPFIIKLPRHLYNFAWLQYLGFYNHDTNITNEDRQFYFKLEDNIDMSAIGAIPPIGTETNPFIGNFDGQGYVVSNVTISNDFSDYHYHPSVMNNDQGVGVWNNTDHLQPHVLGFFGVVGYRSGNKSTVYSSAVNEFIDTGLTGVNVKTVVQDSLVGVAAGCVYDSDLTDAHNVLSNVVIDNSKLTLPTTDTTTYSGTSSLTTNVSDYTLVGYTNNAVDAIKGSKSVYGVNIDNNIEFSATEDGNSTGWGGSIDMKSVLERLQTIRGGNSYTYTSFDYRQTYDYHAGSQNPTITANATDTTRTKIVNDNDTIGHFNFIHDNSTDNANYALMGGGHWQTTNRYAYYSHSGYPITNGTYFLTMNGGSLGSTTNTSSKSLWSIPASSGQITTVYNGTTYYLRNNGGSLTVTDSSYSATTWTISRSAGKLSIVNGNYHIYYENNGFILKNFASDSRYTISDGNGNYLCHPGSGVAGDISNSTSIVENSLWYLISNTYYGSTSNGYYLRYYQGGNKPLYVNNNTNTRYSLDSNGYLYTYYNNRNYYAYFNGTSWVGTSDTSTRTKVTIAHPPTPTDNINDEASTTLDGPDERVTSTTSGMNYEDDDVTYFPLTTINNTTDFRPADNNTAYVVAGSSITANNTYSASRTNVRFSKYYAISGNISNDYNSTTGEFSNIYTVNNNLQQESIIDDVDDYERLSAAMSSLGALMKGQTQTYGLHFMESTISMNALTTAKYVKVNNDVRYNYELPVNSIDFHLKEFGYVNFIAGSYFVQTSGDRLRNDSFFSLYQIERTAAQPNKINRILEVKQVYQHTSKTSNYSYVYQLYDGTNTFYTKPYKVVSSEGDKEWLYDDVNDYEINQYVNALPANYTPVFDVSRIKKNTIASGTFDKHVYYFEIPMNDGEFCLGSVEGAIGSYLLYLDIGANAAKTNRTIVYEKFTVTQTAFTYPAGVSIQPLPTSYTAGTAVIGVSVIADDSDSACMKVLIHAKGEHTMDRTANNVALTRGSNTALAPPVYTGDDVTLSGSGDLTVESVAAKSFSYNINRMQYYDYMITTNTLSVTTITDYYTTGVNPTCNRVVEQNRYTGNAVNASPTSTYIYDPTGILGTARNDSANIKIYNSETGIRLLTAEFTDDENEKYLEIDTNRLSSTKLVEFKLFLDGSNSPEDTITLVMDVENITSQTDTYYTFDNYTIAITAAGSTVKVKVLDYTSSFNISVYDFKNKTTSTLSSVSSTITINGETVTAVNQVIPNQGA